MGLPGLSASSPTETAPRTAISEPAGGSETRQREQMLLIAVALGSMLAPLNSTMIVVALPSILDDFGHSLAWGSWIVVSYLVAMAAIQPLGGNLGDRYGRRRMFICGLVGFLLASLGAALAPTIEALIVARTIQALTGATAIPNGVALVRANLPPERQGRAFGMIGSGIAIAAAAGPPLGGIVSETLGWRWIFAANIVLVTPALALASRLRADRPQRRGRFDLVGALLLLIGLVMLALSLTVWRLESVPWVVAPLLGLLAATALLVLVLRARRVDAPALNPALFQRPGFTPATLAVLFSNMAMYTVLLSLPIYLNKRAGWSSGEIGVLLAGLSLQMIIFSPLGGRLSDQRGRRFPAVLGTALIVAGVFPLIALTADWTWFMLLVPLVVLGIGVGLSAAPVQAAAVNAVAASEAGQAAGLFSTMRYLGSILGSAGLAAILSDPPKDSDIRALYIGLTVAALLACAATARLPRGPSHESG